MQNHRKLPFLLLTMAAFALRQASGLRAAVISRDSAAYMDLASQFLAGNWSEGLAHHYPPLYPLLLALGGVASGEVSEGTSIALTALAGATLVPAVAVLAARSYGRTAALFAALLASVLPLYTELGGEILADSLHLTLIAWTLVLLQHLVEGGRRAPLAAIGAALFGAAAYLVRPEGLVVVGCGWLALLLAPRPAGAGVRHRLTDAAWMAVPALLALVPFLFYLKTQNTLDGTGSGTFKLTLKQNLSAVLSMLTPRQFGINVLETLRLWGKSLGPGVVLLAITVLGPHAKREGAPRRLAMLSAAVGIALLFTFALIRADRRFVTVLVFLALPHAGWGAVVLVRWLPFRRPLARTALALVLLSMCLPFALRTIHARKASYRNAGSVLADAGALVVLARDSRPGYYAGARTLPLIAYFPAGDPPDAQALLEVIDRVNPDAVVLVVDDDAKVQMSDLLIAQLSATRVQLRQKDTLPLDVFLLKRP